MLGCSAPDGAGAFYPPTVLAGIEEHMVVAQEEIFGPVVTVIPFEDEGDAIRIANAVKYGRPDRPVLVSIHEAHVHLLRVRLGDAFQQRTLLHAVAAPDAGNDEHVHLAREAADERALCIDQPGLIIDSLPSGLLLGVPGGDVVVKRESGSEFDLEESGVEHGCSVESAQRECIPFSFASAAPLGSECDECSLSPSFEPPRWTAG